MASIFRLHSPQTALGLGQDHYFNLSVPSQRRLSDSLWQYFAEMYSKLPTLMLVNAS